MAIKELKVCDVYDTTRGVIEIDFSVDGTDYKADLSPRALARLKRWIERGLRPPRKETADDPRPTS